MAAPRRGLLLRSAWVLHRFTYRLTGGRLGSRAAGLPVLELTTRGRTSGDPRSVLLNFQPHELGWVVVASNAGHNRHPAWWLNLRASPLGRVRVRRSVEDVKARELEGAEREEQWRRMVAANHDYAEYEARTVRSIPVVLLERA
ncbi:MAG: nitroreductase/quinone reductase family protein [Actinomycetota bacterium]